MCDVRDCPRCQGTGRDPYRGGDCYFCRGTGETAKFVAGLGLLSWLLPTPER